MGQSDQIDSTLILNEKKESDTSAKSFDPLGQIPPGFQGVANAVQQISLEDTFDQKETEAKLQRGEFVNNI